MISGHTQSLNIIPAQICYSQSQSVGDIVGLWCFYRTQVSLGSDLWVRMMSVTPRLFADLTDVTLADEDSNSKPADYVNWAILGNVAMQVAPPDGKN